LYSVVKFCRRVVIVYLKKVARVLLQ